MRWVHYPPHELAVQLADKVGLPLWEDSPVDETVDFGNSAIYNRY